MAARRAAIEKSQAAYIKLECGHWTTREDQKFRPPRRGLFFCDDERCMDWRTQCPLPLHVVVAEEQGGLLSRNKDK